MAFYTKKGLPAKRTDISRNEISQPEKKRGVVIKEEPVAKVSAVEKPVDETKKFKKKSSSQ